MSAGLRNALRILLGVSAVLVAAVATAATTTNSPGSYCTAMAGGTLSIRTDGEIENRSALIQTAECPIERPITSTKVSGQVFVVDRSTATDVCCKLVSKNPGGARIDGPEVCSSGSSTSYQALSLPELSDSFTYSHFLVQCRLPAINGVAASRIQLYRTTQ